MIKTLSSVFLCLLGFVGYAQKTFVITDGLSKYQIRISIDGCKTDSCRGKGIITFADKKGKKEIQTLAVQDLLIRPVAGSKEPLHQIDLTKDFNFDGESDLLIKPIDAISGQSIGMVYGGIYYVFDKKQKQFVLHQQLDKLGNEALYGWQINKEKKRLESVYGKSVTAYENLRAYEWSAKGELVLVYEAYQTMEGEYVITTIRELKNGKWVEAISKKKL